MKFRWIVFLACVALLGCAGQKPVKQQTPEPLPILNWNVGDVVVNFANLRFQLRLVSDTTQGTVGDTLSFTAVAEVGKLPLTIDYGHLIFGGPQEISVRFDTSNFSILEIVKRDVFISKLMSRNKTIFLKTEIFKNGKREWIPPMPPPAYRWEAGQEVSRVDLGYCRVVFTSDVKQSAMEDEELQISVKVKLVKSFIDIIEQSSFSGPPKEYFIEDSAGKTHYLIRDIMQTPIFEFFGEKIDSFGFSFE